MAHSDITEIHKIVYDELDTTIKQIRVLELFPGDDADPIQCKTHRVNLADYPSYTALSYVWGDARRTESITFNGNSDFSVTHNLWVALHHLRKGNRGSVFLWVDALCINQTHFDEKSRQVEHMGEIYRQATKTCIFLGASADDSDHAIDVLERLDGANLQSDANTLTDRDLRALAALMQRPWWSRVWIIQEAL
ncbi:heterokaryon incompatibility protein-domain-containing protein, partial [Bombardia bombarda]